MAGEDILSLIQQFAPVNADNVAALGKNKNDVEQAGQEALAAQQKAAELNKIIEQQKNDAELQAQIRTQVMDRISGGNIQDPNSLMAALVQDRAAQERSRMAQAKKIEQMDSVGFLDNPIQYITNAFSINGEIDKHNFHAQQAEADTTAITAIQHGTQEEAKVAALAANRVTQATQAAKTEQAAQLLAVETAKLKSKLAGENMSAIHALMQGQQQQVQTAYTGMRVQLDLAQESRAQADEVRKDNAARMAEESFLLHTQEANMRMDVMQEQLATRKENEEMRKLHASTVAAGAAQYRLNPENFNVQSISMMEKTPEGKLLIDKLSKAGLVANTSVAGTLGDTPGEALFNIDQVGAGRAFQQAPEAGTYNRIVAAKEAAKAALGPQTGSPAAQNAALVAATDTEILNRVRLYTKDAEARDSFYAAPKLASLVQNVPELQNTLMYATVLKPMLDAGVTDITAGSIKAQIAEAVKRGILPERQAMIEGAKVFSAVATYNNVFGKLAEFGIPTQKGYAVKGGTQPGWFSGTQLSFNLANPTDFQKWYLYENIMGLSGSLGAMDRPLVNKGATELGVR